MTITVTSNQLLAILPVILPLLVAFVAGILRQDGLSPAVNDTITTVLLLAGATAYAFLLHKLTSNIELDFIVVAGYAAAAMQLPQLQSLQGYLQSNVLAFLKTAGQFQPPRLNRHRM